LLANIYLNKLDRIWEARCRQLGVLIRYADDFVAMCGTESRAREALRRIGLVRLGLTLHPGKTRMVDLRRGKESFVFLGCTIRKKRSIQRNPRWHFMQRWPSPKATKKLRARVRELTGKRQSGKDVKQIIAELNPVLRGWGNYFRTGNADREFNKMDSFVVQSLRRWQHRRGGQRAAKRGQFTWDQLRGMGLYRLMGTVKYPTQATPRRSSLSRVPYVASRIMWRPACKALLNQGAGKSGRHITKSRILVGPPSFNQGVPNRVRDFVQVPERDRAASYGPIRRSS